MNHYAWRILAVNIFLMGMGIFFPLTQHDHKFGLFIKFPSKQKPRERLCGPRSREKSGTEASYCVNTIFACSDSCVAWNFVKGIPVEILISCSKILVHRGSRVADRKVHPRGVAGWLAAPCLGPGVLGM